MRDLEPDDPDRLVGLRLKGRRRERGLSLDELGEAVGATAAQLERIEAGRARVGAPLLVRLARALDVPVAWFFRGDR